MKYTQTVINYYNVMIKIIVLLGLTLMFFINN